ncbi:MAG: gamma carbonic anhydrase family protein [Bryobacter sp.]|nr:gamma carbonic anhydrase family protein [Bryobacter sp.]
MIRALRGVEPQIASSCFIDPSAQVIGRVEIGERSSVWPLVSIRGDVHYIRIGEETNIQDNSVLHVEAPDYPLVIGNRVTVGHMVCLHGCTVEDDALIGIGAIVLNGARIGQGAVIAAGTLVPEGKEIPAGMLAMGVPAKVVRAVSPEEAARFRANCQRYVEGREIYRQENYT